MPTQVIRFGRDEPSRSWVFEDASGPGPAGRIRVPLGAGVEVHLDRLEPGRILRLSVPVTSERWVPHTSTLVSAAAGAMARAALDKASPSTFERAWSSDGWLASAAIATSGDDHVRHLWHAEIASALVDAPDPLTTVAQEHARVAIPTLDAVARHLSTIRGGWGSGLAEQTLVVWARAVRQLLGGDVPAGVDELAEIISVPDDSSALDEYELVDLAADAVLGFRGGGSAEQPPPRPAQSVDHLDTTIDLIDGATWQVEGQFINVEVTVKAAPTEGSIQCWARTVDDGRIVQQEQLVFLRGRRVGTTHLFLPSAGAFEVHVTMDKESPVATPEERRRRQAVESGARLADQLRASIEDADLTTWDVLAGEWRALADVWEGLGETNRASIARDVAATCDGVESVQRRDLTERFGVPSRRSAVQAAIGRVSETIARDATPQTLAPAVLTLLEGVWSASVLRLGHALWTELNHWAPEVAYEFALRTVAASAGLDDSSESDRLAELLGAIGGGR